MLDTVTLVSTPDAVAVQISASPDAVAARWTRDHVSPAPAMVSVCALLAAGPSDAANATSTSPALVVLNACVVRLPRPSEKTILSTVGGTSTGFAIVTATGDDVAVLPARSRATAVSVCGPLASDAVLHITL